MKMLDWLLGKSPESLMFGPRPSPPEPDTRVWELRKHESGMWYAVVPETGEYLQNTYGQCVFFPDRETLATRMQGGRHTFADAGVVDFDPDGVTIIR